MGLFFGDVFPHQGPPIVGPPFPYYSHTTPPKICWSMGMVWEAYGKGVPLLGAPGEIPHQVPGMCFFQNSCWQFNCRINVGSENFVKLWYFTLTEWFRNDKGAPPELWSSSFENGTPTKFSIAPEKWWLEDYFPVFAGAMWNFQAVCSWRKMMSFMLFGAW